MNVGSNAARSVFERFAGDGKRLRALALLLFSRRRLAPLAAERDALRAECDRLAARLAHNQAS